MSVFYRDITVMAPEGSTFTWTMTVPATDAYVNTPTYLGFKNGGPIVLGAGGTSTCSGSNIETICIETTVLKAISTTLDISCVIVTPDNTEITLEKTITINWEEEMPLPFFLVADEAQAHNYCARDSSAIIGISPNSYAGTQGFIWSGKDKTTPSLWSTSVPSTTIRAGRQYIYCLAENWDTGVGSTTIYRRAASILDPEAPWEQILTQANFWTALGISAPVRSSSNLFYGIQTDLQVAEDDGLYIRIVMVYDSVSNAGEYFLSGAYNNLQGSAVNPHYSDYYYPAMYLGGSKQSLPYWLTYDDSNGTWDTYVIFFNGNTINHVKLDLPIPFDTNNIQIAFHNSGRIIYSNVQNSDTGSRELWEYVNSTWNQVTLPTPGETSYLLTILQDGRLVFTNSNWRGCSLFDGYTFTNLYTPYSRQLSLLSDRSWQLATMKETHTGGSVGGLFQLTDGSLLYTISGSGESY